MGKAQGKMHIASIGICWSTDGCVMIDEREHQKMKMMMTRR